MKRLILLLLLLTSTGYGASVVLSQQSSEISITTTNTGQACWSSTTAPCKVHLAWSYTVPAGYTLIDYCIQGSQTAGGTRWQTVTPSGGGTPVLEPWCGGHSTTTSFDDTGIWPDQTYYFSVAAELSGSATSTGGEAANQYYVATNGSDSNTGAFGHPWLTLSKANAAFALGTAGAVINVSPGTYSQGAAQLSLTRGGSSSIVPVIYQCTAVRACTISNTLTGNNAVVQVSSSYVHLLGFNVTSASGSTPNLSRGVYITGHDIWVKSSSVYNIQADCALYGGGGIVVADNAGNNSVFDSNTIHDIGWAVSACATANTVHGINISPKAPAIATVTNNIIYHVKGGWGIEHAGAKVGSTGSIFANNLIFSCGNGGIAFDEFGGQLDYNTVINNVIAYNGTSQSKYGIYESSVTGTHNHYANNDVYGNAGSDYLFSTGSQTGGVSVDPAAGTTFLDWQADGSGDYHEKSGSSTIDAGASTCATGVSHCAPSTDYDGVPRPFNTLYDIGPFEYGGTGSVPLPPSGVKAVPQ